MAARRKPATKKRSAHRQKPLAPESTSRAACAADERRPLRLTLTPETAEKLQYIAGKREAHAGRGVEGNRLVFVDTDAIVAELIAREATRLRGGGRLPPPFASEGAKPTDLRGGFIGSDGELHKGGRIG